MADAGTQVLIHADEIPDMLVTLVGLIAPQRDGAVTREQTLIGDLGYHSIALAELGFTVEDLFRFETLTPETAMSLQCVGDIVDLVGKHVADGTANLPEASEVEAIWARYGEEWPPAEAS
jgi:acyl carrier protein